MKTAQANHTKQLCTSRKLVEKDSKGLLCTVLLQSEQTTVNISGRTRKLIQVECRLGLQYILIKQKLIDDESESCTSHLKYILKRNSFLDNLLECVIMHWPYMSIHPSSALDLACIVFEKGSMRKEQQCKFLPCITILQ